MVRLRHQPGVFFWKLFLGNAALMALLWAVSVWFVLAEFERLDVERVTATLRAEAAALIPAVGERLDPARAGELDALAKEVAATGAGGLRVTVVRADGTVLGDSEVNPAEMESHADRVEIRQALRGGWGESTRFSDTLLRELKYVAVRLGPEDAPRGVLRVAMPVQRIGARLRSTRRLVWEIALAALAAAVVLALGLARLWSGRIGRITSVARSVSRGDLSARINVAGRDEVAVLAASVDRMRRNLAGQLATIDRHRRTLASLLGQLTEGVVVARPDGRIILMNPAAVRLLNAPYDINDNRAGEGAIVEECVPQHELQRMLLSKPEPGAGEAVAASPSGVREARVELSRGGKGSVSVLARGSDILLPDFNGAPGGEVSSDASSAGRLLVLTDVTELTRAMQVKADFAANASHELRTPLSAIRAAAETLLAMDLVADPGSAGRFVQVIDRHSARLEALVSDLLDLSGLESGQVEFTATPLDLTGFCHELHGRWAEALRAKKLRWQCELAPECRRVTANAHLLQLILDNLVDNAIKFTDEGGRVGISGTPAEEGVALEVADDGCGIAPEEQDRVFERFYQVERARSGARSEVGEIRGTGLGLSIVKHAVASMHGSVRLQSAVGEGTRVTVTIPQP